MKFLVVLATFSALFAGCLAEHIIYIIADNGTVISEDLDEPSAVKFAVEPKKLRYFIYTKDSKTTPEELYTGDTNSLKASRFNAGKPTKFLIHGWQGSYQGETMQNIKNGFVNNLDVNVIMGDYEPYNAPYNEACNNAKTIANNFAKFIDFLVANGLRLKDLHIIGHSLGAHISGFTAKDVNGVVPRITGMDPAGPNFNKASEADRLNRNHASYVDILHTSTLVGITDSIGTADFYPNGGENQPNCKGMFSGGCDHTEACTYYARSLTNPKSFPATKCRSVSDARQAKPSAAACSSSPAYMGEPALTTAPSGIYHVSF